MNDTNEKKRKDESETAFIDHQRSLDNAKNERIKDDTGSDNLDPEQANNPARRNHKTDISLKKSGGGKQSNPGD